MNDRVPLKQVIQSLKTGVAVVDRESWEVLAENALFFEWIPPVEDGDEPLVKRLPELKAERALDRIERRGSYSVDHEVKQGARTLPLSIEFRLLSDDDPSLILVECRDLSKQREAEYMLESYSKMAEKNAREIQKEKERTEKLLLNIMPRAVYEELKDFGTTTPQRFEGASVLMLDFVGFTDMAISRDPGALVAELNDIFSAFDRIVELFGCERIKTIGDAYLAVSGLPDPNPDHAANIAKVALRMRRYITRRNDSHPTQWNCRIGVATGPVVGSMVGIQKYVYDIFGPAVNLATRVESLADPMQILISEDTKNAISDDFVVAEGEVINVKGFGEQTIYELKDEKRRSM